MQTRTQADQTSGSVRRADALIRRLHRRLLPDEPHIGWTPYLWLVYLGFFYMKYLFTEPLPGEPVAVVLATGLFLYLYFTGYWRTGRDLAFNIAAIAAIGIAMAPINSGASVFFVFAGAFIPFMTTGKRVWLALLALLATLAAVALWLQPSVAFWGPAAVITTLITMANHHFATVERQNKAIRRSQAEVERVAQVAERERIARDLHDLLGHTLSVIALKSELANKLIERDTERAGREVAEVERISREALAQVREAVSGYRRQGLQGELDSARLALEAAGIEFELVGEPPEAPPAAESVLAMVLREAVTNVIRHADARRCRIAVNSGEQHIELTVQDDGVGGVHPAGSGLDGMRHRVHSCGGRFHISGERGTRLWVTVPREPPRDARIAHDAA